MNFFWFQKIWTEELTEQLILFYKEREYLWNRSDKHYRDVNKKRTAQLEIGELLGFTSEEILKRWTNLRNTYGQNLKQEQKFISAGSAKEIRWAHYKSLDFLIPQMLLSGLVDNSVNETQFTFHPKPKCLPFLFFNCRIRVRIRWTLQARRIRLRPQCHHRHHRHHLLFEYQQKKEN